MPVSGYRLSECSTDPSGGDDRMNYSHVTRLYKYKKIDKNLINALKESKIYAPTLDQLNDPFESKINIRDGRLTKRDRDQIDYFVASLKSGETEIKSESGMQFLSNIYFKNNLSFPNEIDVSRLKKYNSLIRSIILNLGIISFTVDLKSVLMWSHYGDSHKGVCLGFRRSRNNVLGRSELCFPVNYSAFRKEVDYSEDDRFILDSFRLKADIWSYEKEWRLLVNQGSKLVDLPGELVEIYFGLKTTEKDIDMIKDVLGNRIMYYRARITSNYYKLDYDVV